MGGSQSTRASDSNVGEINQSGGFHILEIHAPSIGGTLVVLLIIAAIAAAAYTCYRRLQKRAWSNFQAHHQVAYHAAPQGRWGSLKPWKTQTQQALAYPTLPMPEGV